MPPPLAGILFTISYSRAVFASPDLLAVGARERVQFAIHSADEHYAGDADDALDTRPHKRGERHRPTSSQCAFANNGSLFPVYLGRLGNRWTGLCKILRVHDGPQ